MVTEKDEGGDERGERREDRGTGRERDTMTHERWESRDMVYCRRCGREEKKEKEGRRALDDACTGAAAGKALAHASGNKNFIWNERRYTEAETMMKGASLTEGSRVPLNMIDESKVAEVEEARKSRQGGTRGTGEERRGEENLPWTWGPSRKGRQGERREAGGGEENLPWMRAPSWMPRHLWLRSETQEDQEKEEQQCEGAETVVARARNGGHLIRTKGPLVWCARCACFAVQRHGRGLKAACAADTSSGHTRSLFRRLQRLEAGLHPVTGRPV